MTYGRQLQRLQLIVHVTTEISDNKWLPSLESLVCIGTLISPVITISERVLHGLKVMKEDG